MVDSNEDDYDDTPKEEVKHSLPHPEELKIKNDNSKNYQKESKSTNWKTTLAGVAGNVLEWYDFAVFGYFGDIIGDVFFPPQAGHAAMVESFLVFGGAFIMRPIGGCVMGYIGDLYGRKKALEISIFLMAFPTFAMGCLPTYEQMGWISVVMLAVVRMLQGLSVGGQLVSSLVFTVESRPRHKWGLYGSYVMASANFGTLLGGFVAYGLRKSLSDEDLKLYGWRIPFWSGILVSLSGLYLKLHGVEDHHHQHSTTPQGTTPIVQKNPLLEALSAGNRMPLLSAALVPMLWSAGFYVSFVWMAIYMSKLVDPPVPGAFGVNSLSLFVSVCVFFPLTGILSDHFGRTRVMYSGGLAMAFTSPFLILVISYGDTVAAFFAQSFLGIILSLWGGPMCAWLVESFPPSARLTSVAIGYNIAQATVGGLSPAIATWVVDQFSIIAPGFFISIIAILSLIGLYVAPQNGNDSSIPTTTTTTQDHTGGGGCNDNIAFSKVVMNEDFPSKIEEEEQQPQQPPTSTPEQNFTVEHGTLT